MAIRDDFWAHCDQSGGPACCWPWQRSLDPYGYGRFKNGRKLEIAHRFAYLITKGTIPSSHVVMHSCDNRKCVNPVHLSVGTISDNIADRDTKGRQRTRVEGRAHLTPENVRKIRLLVSEGIPRKEIAALFGCSRQAIRNIALGRAWRSV